MPDAWSALSMSHPRLRRTDCATLNVRSTEAEYTRTSSPSGPREDVPGGGDGGTDATAAEGGGDSASGVAAGPATPSERAGRAGVVVAGGAAAVCLVSSPRARGRPTAPA